MVKVGIAFGDQKTVSVGRLAQKNKQIYFEYDEEFLKKELNIWHGDDPTPDQDKAVDRILRANLSHDPNLDLSGLDISSKDSV